MNNIKLLLFYATATFALLACGNRHETSEPEAGFIEITRQQFITDSMQLGEIETRIFENVVKCSGYIIPLPNGAAMVNAPIGGLVKNVRCSNGQFVDKNQVILEIGGMEIIDLQREFAEVAGVLPRLKSEYKRVKTLYDEKVSSEKDFILAESEYKVALAKYNGLKLKIEATGLSAAKIENGDFYTSYFLTSPVDGYISDLQANIGATVDTKNELIRIVNPYMLQVKLSVFPNDIAGIKKGQSVRIKTGGSDNTLSARLNSVGAVIDEETKSLYCYASIINNEDGNMVANEFVESEIITSADSVNALPEEAIIKTESGNFILILSKQDGDRYYFTSRKVNTGRERKGFYEITDNKTDGLILTRGSYNISIAE